ncbi:MAG TPA: hypothetical protein PK264_23720 [Hyphomicrobiaceae bacterium]|nr:hypothetical protein [Hyphomicrobiaceae bacterium]
MPTHTVVVPQLNLRSAPDPTKKNVIATLAQGTPVDKLANSGVAGWFEIAVTIAGTQLRGHVNSRFLGPVSTAFPSASVTAGRLPAADMGSKATEKRSVTGTRTHSIKESGKPGRPSTHGSGKAAGILRIIDWMDVGNDAHLRWQPGGGKTFCNIYVYDIADTAGCYVPRVWWNARAIADLKAGKTVEAKINATVDEVRANYIFKWLEQHGADFGWKRVFDPDVLQTEVNAGRLGIICAQRTDMERPGHIQIIAPEHGEQKAKRSAAGKVTQPLQSNAGSRNFTYGHLGTTWWQGVTFRQFGFWTSETA